MGMSSINFECAECNGDFEIDIVRIIERPGSLKCTHCSGRPTAAQSQAFAQALEDVLSAMASLRGKLQFELHVDSEELPPPYGVSEQEAAGGLSDFDDDDFSGDVASDDEDDDEDDELEGFSEEDVADEDSGDEDEDEDR
jgi:DNA-directed RNA polymerase subunit RPC12/RpoP